MSQTGHTAIEEEAPGPTDAAATAVRAALGGRSVVLIGMMGAGKSSVGRRLAAVLGLPFADADTEIERAAGMSVEDIFTHHGEPYFRDGEERVIKRILSNGPLVLATGGGAFMSERLRGEIAARGISVWLRADVDLLMQRVMRRDNRPLLKTPDPRGTMERLLRERAPVYGFADVIVDSRDVSHEYMVGDVTAALLAYLNRDARDAG